VIAREPSASDGVRVALDLIDFTERMLVQRLKREHPEETDDDIAARVDAWYAERPGAELGDAEGVPGSWPRSA
jgi:hypothetical protein